MKLRLTFVLMVVFLLMATGCQRMSINSGGSEINSNEESPKNVIKGSIFENPYDTEQVRIGDYVNGMEVTDIRILNEEESNVSNGLKYSITFKGEFEVTGTCWFEEMEAQNYYIASDIPISDVLPFSSFEKNIEEEDKSKMKVGFYIENEKDLVNELNRVIDDYYSGAVVDIKAVFTNYRFDLYDNKYRHWATFVKLTEVSSDDT